MKAPTLIPQPTADSEIRDQAGSNDVTYQALDGAPHYLEGHQRPEMEIVVDWLRSRF